MTNPLTTSSTLHKPASAATIGMIAGALGAIGIMEGASGGIWPDVLDHFGLGDSALGPAFAIQALFVLPVLLFGGQLLQRFGLRLMLGGGAILMAAASFGFISFSTSLIFFSIFIIRGVGVALLDLAANTMAMHVEREDNVHIMGIVHGGFSLGIVFGSLGAFAIYSLGGDFDQVHLALALTILLIAAAAFVGPIPKLDDDDVVEPITTAAFRMRMVRICAVLLGIAFGTEVLISQFVSVLLRARTDASESVAVLSVVVYATMMAIGRFSNSWFLRKFDPISVLIAQGIGVAIGGVILTLSPTAGITLVGSFVGGLAIAGIVPTVLSYAAAHSPGSAGETASASLLGGYIGGLILPLAAGGLTSLFSIRAGIALVALGGVMTIVLTKALQQDAVDESRSSALPGGI